MRCCEQTESPETARARVITRDIPLGRARHAGRGRRPVRLSARRTNRRFVTGAEFVIDGGAASAAASNVFR